MSDISKLEKHFKDAFLDTLKVRSRFSKIEGYVRKKTGTEQSLQKAKKTFGEFQPDNHDAMKRNDNGGKGVDVQLESGEKLHLHNQFELFEQVVKYNKEHGGFYNEEYIAQVSPPDFKLLQTTDSELKNAKYSFVNSFPKEQRAQAYKRLRELERQVRTANPSLAPAGTKNRFQNEIDNEQNAKVGTPSKNGVLFDLTKVMSLFSSGTRTTISSLNREHGNTYLQVLVE